MANAILNVGQTGGQVNISTAAAPATPAAGVVTLYAGTDKALHALNSDGTDITIAAAGAASPITVQQTNSLVSTAVGGTATVGSSIVIGLNASKTSAPGIVIGCATTSSAGVDGSITIGDGACQVAGNGGLVIGNFAKGCNASGGIAIGYAAEVKANTSTVIGQSSIVNSGSIHSLAIGAFGARICNSASYAISITSCNATVCSTGGIAIGNESFVETSSVDSLVVGHFSKVKSTCSKVIGNNSTVHPGATGTMVLGNSSVGGTGACNSVVIGNSSQTTGACAIAIGSGTIASAESAVVIGKSACIHSGAANSIVIGTGSCHYAYGSDSVLIGKGVRSSNIGTIGIGEGVISETQRGLAIGNGAATLCNNALGAMAIGYGTVANGDSNCAGIAIGISAKAFRDGIHLGCGGFSCASQSTVVGLSSQSFPGATGTMVLGNSSVGGTGACNSVVIGNSSQTTGACSVVIGQASCATAASAVVIGNSKTAPGPFDINIGGCTNNSITSTDGHSMILGGKGNCITAGDKSAIIATYDSCIQNSGGRAMIIGAWQSCIIGGSYGGFIAGGANNCGSGYNTTMIGTNESKNCTNGFSGIYSGQSNQIINATGCQSFIGGGELNCIFSSGCNNAILGGRCNVLSSNYCNSVILGGNTITAEKSNTVHVDNLIAFGQAASKTNAVGSTGGSVTLNWDNSNIQTLTLTDNITTLTKSNPIDGAVYTLFLTQGGTGGKTVSWGTDVEWPGGTPPTLSTAAGSVDAVSLIYIAGVTGYFGNANLNFS